MIVLLDGERPDVWMTETNDTRFEVERRPMTAVLAANTISQFGNTFSMLAIPWFVLATTGSASQTGITVAVGVVPYVVVGILGGAVVDRIGYRHASVISDILSGLSVALIPLLHHTVGLAFWQLLTLVFLGAFFDGPGATARQALFPELVQRARVSLDRANTAFTTTRRVAAVLGQPIAGLLIAAIGPSYLLWVNAATFAVSAAIVQWMVPLIAVDHGMLAGGGLRGYFKDVAGGFRVITGNRLLFALIAGFSLGSLVAEPLYGVILPVYANEVLGSAAQLGFIFAALGAGSIAGNLVYLGISTRVSRSTILLSGFAIRAIAFSVMVFSPSWWMIALAIFIGAVALEPINPMSMSLIQEEVPTGMRGRVFGATTAVAASALPVGLVVYGYLMSNLGLQPTLVLFVGLNLLLAVVLCLSPTLRHIPQPENVVLAGAPGRETGGAQA